MRCPWHSHQRPSRRRFTCSRRRPSISRTRHFPQYLTLLVYQQPVDPNQTRRPNYGSIHVTAQMRLNTYALAGKTDKNLVSRMMADMVAMMIRM